LLLVDADDPKRGIYLQRAEDIAPLNAGKACESPKRPDLEMIATGLLLGRGFERAGKQNYFLDQASVCVVRSAQKP
jgi:hypothetical protein